MLILLLIFVTSLFYIYYSYKKITLPGPRGLPIIGSLYLIDPKAPYLSFTQLAKKYGRIYSIKLGVMNTVVVSDVKFLKQLLLKNETIGRPPMYMMEYFFKAKGLFWTGGNLWKDQRKFVNNYLKTLGVSKFSKNKLLEKAVIKNAQELVEYIKSKGDIATLIPEEPVEYCVNNVSSSLIFGRSWSRDDKMWKSFCHNLHELTTQISFGSPLNLLPFLRFLPKYQNSMTMAKVTFNALHQIQNDIISETQKTFDVNDSNVTNFIHAFLLQKSKCDSEDIYNITQLRYLSIDFFGASAETTKTWILWSICYLTAHQKVQDRVRQELLNVVQQRTLQYEDLQYLPYLEATITEVGRLRTITPAGVPHYASEDIVIEDIKIPKHTMIIPLLWAIHMDPKNWKEPEEFRPERFLNDDGKFSRPESFIPLLIGKRMCPGDEFGRTLVYLTVATLIQNFKIKSASPIDFTGEYGLTLMPKSQEFIFEKL